MAQSLEYNRRAFMNNFRIYGNSPFNVVVIHGGPGAAGEMAPVARELSKDFGVLEPLQTKDSVGGQITELKELIDKYAAAPIYLIGYSWGAWLAYMFAAKYPLFVRKLILVSSGPLEDKFGVELHNIRLSRLTDKEKEELKLLEESLNNPGVSDKNKLFARFGEIFSRTDTYKPLPIYESMVSIDFHIYDKVWPEASELRRSGKLLNMAKSIKCQVVAIQGDYDPTPREGIELLASYIKDFRFILLEKCGHTPWKEKYAHDMFIDTLGKELK